MSKTNEKIKISPVAKQIGAWLYKIDFLKDQISKLEALSDFPIINISVFLLKSQLIEFELKQLLHTVDLHLYFNNHSKLIQRESRTPKMLDQDLFTLGRLVNEYKLFKGTHLIALNKNLQKLVKLRNGFVHHLFSAEKDTTTLSNDADKGIKIANDVLNLIKNLNNKLR